MGAAVLSIVGVLTVAVVVLSFLESRDDERGAPAPPSPPTTTEDPLRSQISRVTTYCKTPGRAMSVVPAYVPSEGSRTHVGIADPIDPRFGEVARAGSLDGRARAGGGSTRLSPSTDGRYERDPSARMRTRTATCVTPAEVTPTGRTCDYYQTVLGGTGVGPSTQLTTARLRYVVEVYELRSGGVLHRGEIVIDDSSCPEYSAADPSKPYVASVLTDEMILDWLGSHFVDGVPA